MLNRSNGAGASADKDAGEEAAPLLVSRGS